MREELLCWWEYRLCKCFSTVLEECLSIQVVDACLQIYFWNKSIFVYIHLECKTLQLLIISLLVYLCFQELCKLWHCHLITWDVVLCLQQQSSQNLQYWLVVGGDEVCNSLYHWLQWIVISVWYFSHSTHELHVIYLPWLVFI
jgi:hypothetical protein